MSPFNKNGSMEKVFAVYKLPGETPLETLGRVRSAFFELENETLSYAGRLDPLAQGVMLVLSGKEANRERDRYLGMDKVYHFEVLFGVESDSFDPLGIAVKGSECPSNIADMILAIQSDWRGEMVQHYPPFSSKTYKGKPLFQWAKEGVKVPLPKRLISIYELSLLDIKYLPVSLILRSVKKRVAMVTGDFRQKEAIQSWERVAGELGAGYLLPVARFRAKVSSGTYIRSMASEMGSKCDTSAMALHISRISVGPFDIVDTVL